MHSFPDILKSLSFLKREEKNKNKFKGAMWCVDDHWRLFFNMCIIQLRTQPFVFLKTEDIKLCEIGKMS